MRNNIIAYKVNKYDFWMEKTEQAKKRNYTEKERYIDNGQ